MTQLFLAAVGLATRPTLPHGSTTSTCSAPCPPRHAHQPQITPRPCAPSEESRTHFIRYGHGGARLATYGYTADGALLVFAHARLVLGEEHLRDKVASAAYTGLFEDVL
jgi:hypothetical protein